MKQIFKYISGALVVSVIFVAAAALHRLGFEGEGYVNSPLIYIEIGLLLLLILSLPIIFITSVVFVITRGWKAAFLVALNIIIVIAAIMIGLALGKRAWGCICSEPDG